MRDLLKTNKWLMQYLEQIIVGFFYDLEFRLTFHVDF